MRISPVCGPRMYTYGPGTSPLAAVSAGMMSRNAGSGKRAARVFVVDDEDFIRELYKDVFESKGMTVFAARDGDEALKVLKTMRAMPDIIIMDHRMPGKDGIETTKEIRSMDPTIPIIFSSADVTVRDAALEAGAISFWAKPFPCSMLVEAMFELIDARNK